MIEVKERYLNDPRQKWIIEALEKYDFLARIGIDSFEKIVERAKINREIYGHNNYEDLAKYLVEDLQPYDYRDIEKVVG